MRLSTAGITAAIMVTFLALLAIAAAVSPSQGEGDAAVSFEAPEVSNGASGIAPAVYTSSKLQPVAGAVSGN